MGLNIAGFDAVGNVIASPAVGTQATQQSRFGNIIGQSIAGTVAVIQALRQPTQTYPPAITGIVRGSTTGAAAASSPGSTFGIPTWSFWLLGGAVFALLGAAIFARK